MTGVWEHRGILVESTPEIRNRHGTSFRSLICVHAFAAASAAVSVIDFVLEKVGVDALYNVAVHSRNADAEGRLLTVHVGCKVLPSHCLPVLALRLTLAPYQLGFSDNQITEMSPVGVRNVKFDAFVFHIHGNIKFLD
jgi:hypothetical protein